MLNLEYPYNHPPFFGLLSLRVVEEAETQSIAFDSEQLRKDNSELC